MGRRGQHFTPLSAYYKKRMTEDGMMFREYLRKKRISRNYARLRKIMEAEVASKEHWDSILAFWAERTGMPVPITTCNQYLDAPDVLKEREVGDT